MASFREGRVVEVVEEHDDLVRAVVSTGTGDVRASAFPRITGHVAAGDRVVINTTGIELSLGTGDEAFVLWNLDRGAPGRGAGHIVKLRYTPWQTEVLAAEEQDSPHHDALRAAVTIDGMPVVACGLHSQAPAAAAGIKAARPNARVAYIMSDGAALPLAWSNVVRDATKAGLFDVTCTYGHAFGGDLEAVNVFSALIAARRAGEADAAVVAMGPGVVGTGTALGFTAMEQGQVLDAAAALEGIGIAALRICFSDERDRHRGVSHHSITSLKVAAHTRALVAVPTLPTPQDEEVAGALRETGIEDRHECVLSDGAPGVALLRATGVTPASMGRSFDDVVELFLAAAAAGALAAERHQPRDTLP